MMISEIVMSLNFPPPAQSRSTSEASSRTRSACMSESAGGCVGASYQGGVFSVSAKACVNKGVSECQAAAGSKQVGKEEEKEQNAENRYIPKRRLLSPSTQKKPFS